MSDHQPSQSNLPTPVPTEIKRLVASIVQFFGDQLSSDLSSDTKESLEVAIQCLESAYEVSSSDAHLLPSKSLLEIFNAAVQNEPLKSEPEVANTAEAKAEAERLKNEGNNCMKSEKFDEALKFYTKAIQLDGKNAVFYCNRAAAYSKLNNHTFALEDCRRAIEIDPNYGKAYGRMGLAYAALSDHHRARDCYKKASELEPNNESYTTNLSIAEDKIAELERSDPLAALAGGLGNFDLGSVLQNPALMQMASQVMSDPAMQNLMSNIMGGLAGGGFPQPQPQQQPPPQQQAHPEGDSPNSANPSQSTQPPLDHILRMGHAFAQRMQESNPELIDQLRQRVQGSGGPGVPGGSPASGTGSSTFSERSGTSETSSPSGPGEASAVSGGSATPGSSPVQVKEKTSPDSTTVEPKPPRE